MHGAAGPTRAHTRAACVCSCRVYVHNQLHARQAVVQMVPAASSFELLHTSAAGAVLLLLASCLSLQARQLRGESLLLPVMRKGKQRGSLQLTVTFTPAGTTSINSSSISLVPGQQQPAAATAAPAAAANDARLLAGQHSSSHAGSSVCHSTAAGAYRPQTPDHPQQQDQHYQLPNSTSHQQGSMCSPTQSIQQAGSQYTPSEYASAQSQYSGQAAGLSSAAGSVAGSAAASPAGPLHTPYTYPAIAGAASQQQQQQPYPGVLAPNPASNSTAWDAPNSSTTSSVSTYPRIHSSYAHASDASLGGLAPAPAPGLLSDSSGGRDGGCSSSQLTGVTELVRSSVNFRGELQQLLAMLGTAETEAAQGISFLERQIEAAAKVCLCAMCRHLTRADAWCAHVLLLLLLLPCEHVREGAFGQAADAAPCFVQCCSHKTRISKHLTHCLAEVLPHMLCFCACFLPHRRVTLGRLP